MTGRSKVAAHDPTYAWDMGGALDRAPLLVPDRADNAENMSDPRNEMNPNHKNTQDA